MFSDIYDGIKNYFTFQAYLEQDPALGFSKLVQQGYPYGDYIFYTDMTPSIAVPLKLFSTYIYDISPYGIPVFNFICILLHLLSVLFSYKIMVRFIETKWLLFTMSICLVWISPQFLRLAIGVYNLSFAVCVLIPIWLLIKIYETHLKNGLFNQGKAYLAYLWGFTIIASFTHLYYLVIIGISIGAFAFFWFLYETAIKKAGIKKNLVILFYLGALVILALLVVMGIIQGIDSYYDLRLKNNDSYNTKNIHLQFQTLYSIHSVYPHTITFPFSKTANETHFPSYLGNFTLYGILILVVLNLMKSKYIIPLRTVLKKQQLLVLLLFMSLVIFSISIGEYYFVSEDLVFYNFLNPFFYLRKVTSMVEHFRWLVRFFWVTFWIWSILAVYIADYYWRHSSNNWIKASIPILVFFAMLDTVDVVSYQNKQHTENFFDHHHAPLKFKELEGIPYQKYQGILPVPFYSDSCEDYNYTIMGNGYMYNKLLFYASLYTNLPTLSIQSSRIPVIHTKNLFSIFTQPKPVQDLLDKLNDKPILVLNFKNPKSLEAPVTQEPAKSVFDNGHHIIQKYNMKKIADGPTFEIYEWDITTLKDNKSTPNLSTQNSISCDAETGNPDTKILVATDQFSQLEGQQSSEKARSGQFGIKLAPQEHGFVCQLAGNKAQNTIQTSVWRHKSSGKGTISVNGNSYKVIQSKVVRDSLDWELVESKITLPPNFSSAPLTISYWNNSGSAAWLDDFQIIRQQQ